MNSLARELRDWVETNGYGELLGQSSANHLRYRLTNGLTYYAALTPSSYTAVANAKADIRRFLGVKSESPPAGHYRHKPSNGYDGRRTLEGAWPVEVQELRAQINLLDEKLRGLDPTRKAKEVRKAHARRAAVVEELTYYGVHVPPFQG